VDRVLTIPNGISAARLAGVPVFLWLVLGPRTATADYWAVALLILAGLAVTAELLSLIEARIFEVVLAEFDIGDAEEGDFHWEIVNRGRRGWHG